MVIVLLRVMAHQIKLNYYFRVIQYRRVLGADY